MCKVLLVVIFLGFPMIGIGVAEERECLCISKLFLNRITGTKRDGTCKKFQRGPFCRTVSTEDPPQPEDPTQTEDNTMMIQELKDRVSALESVQEMKKVFVTSNNFNGDLGGLAGADQSCNDAAQTATPPLLGTYKAWLSSGADSPSNRFVLWPFQYVLVNGTKIADNWNDLTTCDEGPDMEDCLDNPINVDENGNTIVDAFSAWTNTNSDGTTHPDNEDCSAWSPTIPAEGGVGRIDFKTSPWTDIGSSACTTSTIKLYCFQQ